jgi:phage shock protein PspC (stress-responsive transcriptional regulator)
LGGVAQGLANRYDIPVWLSRAFFIVTAFFGGFGVALYAGGWALIRSEDEESSPAEEFFSGASTSKSWIGVGLIFLAALLLLDNLTFLDGGVIWAIALLVVGVLLYSGHINLDGARRKRTEPKEGVQSMTTSDTSSALVETDTPSGDSPSGGGVPPTPTPTPPILPPAAAKPKERSILGRLTIGLMLVGMGVLAILDNIPDIAIEPEPRHYLALAVTILGLGLLVGAIVGRARWLILVAVVLIPTLLFSPVFEWDWNSESFDLRTSPDTFLELEDEYVIEVGSMVVDLTDLPWDGQTVELTMSVDVGDLNIRVPQDVNLVGEASVDIGRVGMPGRESAGFDPSLDFNETDGDLGTLIFEAHVDLGNIDIRNR